MNKMPIEGAGWIVKRNNFDCKHMQVMIGGSLDSGTRESCTYEAAVFPQSQTLCHISQYGCTWLGWCKCFCSLNCLSASVPAAQKYVGNVEGRHFYDCSYAEIKGLGVVVLNDL